jgi:hypothetical protein
MQCAECKGKGMCGLSRCPITSRFYAQMALKPASSYQGNSPSVFIGSYRYPEVWGGPLLIDDSDHPPQWISQGLGIEEIVGIRARTIRGSSPVLRYADSLQEVALSQRPVDVEVAFERPIALDLTFDGTVAPVGLSGTIRTFDVIGNAIPERVVDRVTSDTDCSAADACATLVASDVDVYRIASLMTAGLLGRRRRFVPTRWAITAVDDTLSVQMKKEIARFGPLEEVLLFSGEIFGNRIVCMLIPGDWKYEMIEVWGRHTLWGGEQETVVQDREGLVKRNYSPISGAYYSARLAVCEYLTRIRRSARVILIRSISSDYWAPLGTWVIREATRRAMANPPCRCLSIDDAVREASEQLGFDRWVRYSTLLPEIRTQKTLFQF